MQQFAHYNTTPISCVRISKMQGAEIEDKRSVLKYISKFKNLLHNRKCLYSNRKYLFAYLKKQD